MRSHQKRDKQKRVEIESGNSHATHYDGYEYGRITIVNIRSSLVYSFIVCGLVTVALGAALRDLASNVGFNATDIGSIYVARGVGSVLGSLLSFNAVWALVVTETLTAAVTMSMPSITHLWTLHAAYFMIGNELTCIR